MSRSRWKVYPPAPREFFAKAADIHPLLSQLLYNRGLTDPAQFEAFIAADRRLESNPFLLTDMHQAVSRIYHGLFAGENIAIYGDFDADGITATALLVHGLSALGAKAVPYIPHRHEEGYGLRTAALERLHNQGVNLVITADCGIANSYEVDYARRLGLDVIVTDHHLVTSTLPPACAVVNPKRNPSLGGMELAGVGVAFKLLQAVLQGSGREKTLDEVMDLVALGTVADVAPLVNENRYLVKQGLKSMSKPRLGLAELLRCARLEPGRVSAESISYVIAPRLNAASRLDHAINSYKLLLSESQEEAHMLALGLEEKNSERKLLTNKTFKLAREKVLAQGLDSPLLFAADGEFFAGVIGIAAGKLVDEFNRPAVLVKLDGVSRGSARSIPEFNIAAALKECQDILSRFGGHPMAAGFSLDTNMVDELQRRLVAIARTQLAGLDLRQCLMIDAVTPLEQLTGDTYLLIQQLAPFGQGNPTPVFLSHGVDVVECRTMGGQKEHLRMKLKAANQVWDAVGFDLGSLAGDMAPHLDIVYTLDTNNWSGQEVLRLNLLDFAAAR
ncbi:MAG: recJ [Dehalococcoidia bacterium]|nr:recJ [Dehalococcoidia bacterium]